MKKWTGWLPLVLFALPLGVMLGKLPAFPTSAVFTTFFSLSDVPAHMRRHVEFILLVPMGAVAVAIVRLTLGLRVLGFFRPILIAIAFRIIGMPTGLAFLLAVLTVVALLRPLLKDAHYYSRMPALLSLVAALLLTPLIAGKWWHAAWLRHVAYFPVIALCLTCESFAKVLDREGLAEATSRTATTVLVASVITGLASVPGAMPLFFRFPELLLAQAGCTLLIGRHLAFGLFERKDVLPIEGGASPSLEQADVPAKEPRDAAVRTTAIWQEHQAPGGGAS